MPASRLILVTFPLATIVIDGETYEVTTKGNVAACPECGGPVVWECGLWHCDDNTSRGSHGHGAWDACNIDKTPLSEILTLEV